MTKDQPNPPDAHLSADLDLGFDGAEDLLRAWRRGMRPDPDLTGSQWADQHRKLSSRASAEPGQYRTSRTPYLRDIMDALSPGHPAQRISFMKAAQVGATEAGNNWIGFVIHHAPGPMAAGTIHLADWADSEWLKQLVAEQLVTIRNKRGFARQEWQKLRDRNEALDTRVYARAAAWILGADRFDDRMWQQLEKQAGVEPHAPPPPASGDTPKPDAPEAGQVTRRRRRRGWRVNTPKYME